MGFDRALELFEARGIDPKVAELVGVKEENGALVYPNGRRRPFDGDRKMLHPAGKPLELWQLTTHLGTSVLVCEGETDALSALSHSQIGSGLEDLGIVSMPGSNFPKDRLVEGVGHAEVERVYLAFDADEAGRIAVEQAVKAFAKSEGLPPEIRVVRLPEGMDLAEALTEGASLKALLDEAELAELPAEDPGYMGATVMDGAAFILSESDQKSETLWGSGNEILWISGEPLLICAAPGIGKTTIAQQILLAMIGVREPKLLGYDVRPLPEGEKVLYIAADRPAQAVRSFRRMVKPEHEELLRKKVVVWKGPFPLDRTVEIAERHGCSVVFMDTLAACAGGDLSRDETGMQVYHAMQSIVAAEIDVCVLHHNRKRSGEESGWRGLDEVYGSRWVTAVPGSVIYLKGKQGQETHKLIHVKMPAAPVGPLTIYHNHREGRTYSDNEAPSPTEEELEAINPPPPPQPEQTSMASLPPPSTETEERAPVGMSDPLAVDEEDF